MILEKSNKEYLYDVLKIRAQLISKAMEYTRFENIKEYFDCLIEDIKGYEYSFHWGFCVDDAEKERKIVS